ncbi:MAG: S8 family serine peptidase [Planctomycetota bacterium]|jgi:subtilisin family serine protease
MYLTQRVAISCTVLLLAISPPTLGQDRPFIDPEVERGSAGLDETTFLILLREKADLSPAFEIRDWGARGRFVTQRLRQVADRSQAGLREMLTAWGADFESFWIVNSILVTGDDPALLSQLAARPEVAAIRAPGSAEIPELTPGGRQSPVGTVEWNIDHIGAPLLWSAGVTGEGIVVASLDSGVHYTHPALVSQYRGNDGKGSFNHNYNWFDTTGFCPLPEPCDDPILPHGTFVTGFMVGDDGGTNQIGVAPGARWIAVRGLTSPSPPAGGDPTQMLAAAQWLLEPTDLNGENPNSDLRPHVINNSWGFTSPTEVFRDALLAWIAAGIFPVFAVHNDGPACMTSRDPGNHPESYAVGAHDIDNNVGDFSGRGPSPSGTIKPDIAAPGVNVRSSVMVEFDPSGYFTCDCTSGATPHVAGTVALLWSGRPELIGDVAATRALLDSSAIDVSDLTCGGTPDDNNAWGEGRLDAFAAFGGIFADGFESGDTSAWSNTVP